MTIREASLALGVSELTIRRRIKDGRMPHRLEAGKYYVNPAAVARPAAVELRSDPIDGDAAGATEAMTIQQPTTREQRTVPVQQLLPEYGRLAEQAGRASVLHERVQQLEAECATLRDGIVTLSNRNGWLESKLEEREHDIKLLSDSRHKVSWWRRLFGGGGGNDGTKLRSQGS